MTARVAERILICRPDHLGDVLLTLPAVAALRAAFPGAYIGLVLDCSTADVASRCPDVDEGFALPFPPLTHREAGADWAREVTGTASVLRGRYDLVILARQDPWSAQLAAAADIPVRVGYAMPGTECFLTHAIPLREELHAAVQTLRLAQEAARCLGVSPAGEAAMTESLRSLAQVRFVPTADEEALAEHVLSEAPSAGARPIVFQPGSGWPLKNWAAEQWGALGTEIRRRWGVTALVPGGPGESALVRAVVESGKGSCFGLAERLSVGALAALYRRSSLVIGIDSGALHLAALVGARIIGLYGPGDHLRWHPWCPPQRYRIVRVALPCSPCDCIFDPPCGIGLDPPCMTGITVEAVLHAAADMLSQ
ncbi:MAG: glycosyltransferase family 9 protein [Gammaproteobacteria bacterium]|nr:glycosyltransferase family 9 protein [Gammaproteobacteria bacterium]